jgi:iron complex outermembrane receptor protein
VHGEEDGHDHGYGDHDEDEHGHEEGSVRIDLVQDRWDLRGGIYDPLGLLQRVDLRMALNDYTHTELESEETGTLFANRGIDGRIEALQNEIAGWRGAFGLQFGRARFRADGEEAFVPATRTGTLGLFALQEKDFDPVKIELGARYDQVKLEPDSDARRRRFNLTNLSADAIWRVNDRIDLRLGLDRSERAPINEELFAAGLHVATRSLEVGDASLDTERANRAEFGLHAHTARMTFKAALYQTDFTDFIYLADTGIVEHTVPVRLWTQQDAVFRGAEAESVFHLLDAAAGRLDLRVFGDAVRARLDGHGSRSVALAVPHSGHYTVELSNEGNVPRLAPTRVGASLAWASGGLSASAGAVRHQAQNRVADSEEPSPGYTLIDAHLAYRWDTRDASWEAFLDASNLGDKEARPHTSLLRDYAPLPGRALAFGVRVYF